MTQPRRGRPPLDVTDPSVSVHVRITSKEYDALWRRACAAHRTLSAQIRREFATLEREGIEASARRLLRGIK